MEPDLEALIGEVRRQHPRWGARRVRHELGRRQVESVPSRAAVHRVLSRNGLIAPQEQEHKRKYKRWQREAPMQLWQMDLVGGVFLADGRECKMVTGIDDHSRYIVIAAVVVIPTGRAVVEAFITAMRRYGVPSEVPTDKGKQFTGRFTRPYPAEVLLERICRENGISQRLTKRRSPTTTGKIAVPQDAARGAARRCRGVREPRRRSRCDLRVGARVQPQPAAPVFGEGQERHPFPAHTLPISFAGPGPIQQSWTDPISSLPFSPSHGSGSHPLHQPLRQPDDEEPSPPSG